MVEEDVFEELALQEQVSELKKSLRRTNRALDKAKAKRDDLHDAVYQAAYDVASGMEHPKVEMAKPRKGRSKHDETAICLLADWQYGKLTPEYNAEKARDRLEAYAAKVVSIIGDVNEHHRVTDARIYLLGDLVEGELIFPGQAHRIDRSLFRQVFEGAEILEHVIRTIATAVPSLKVRGVIGNHGEIGGRSRRDMHPESNADAMLMETARLHLPDIDFAAPLVTGERAWFVKDEVRGKQWFLAHGNQVKGASFGVPWYGFKNKALGWSQVLGPIDYMATGHWHQQVRHDISGIQHFGAGSTESANTYAQEFLAGGGQEGSQYLVFQNDRGLTSEWPIRLE